MSSNKPLFFRFLLFLLGAAVFVFIFYLQTHGKEISYEDQFLWASMGLMYLILFCPFFFTVLSVKGFSAKIPSLGIVWAGISLYIFFSFLVIIFLKSGIASMSVALSVQAVLLFLFIVTLYFGYYGNYYVRKVATEEAGLKNNLVELKSVSELLALKASVLPAQYAAIKKKIKQAQDDIRYLSPVSNDRGDELDRKIIEKMKIIIQYCETATEGAASNGLDATTEKLQMLIRERKLLRNG